MKRNRWHVLGWCVAMAAMISFVPRAHASQSFDNQRGELAARVATQNTFQHNNADSINWVQWRNELRFDLSYHLIPQGESFGPFKTLKANLLYRGRYDAAFDLRDSYRRRDYNRGDFEFPEGRTPREMFLDIGFGGALSHLSLRIGKQQVVWGEADLFRSLDIVNPLDLRQSGAVGEDFSDFRQPLWIAKALYDFGNIGSFWNEAGLEVFFSPNSRPQANQYDILVGETYKIHTTQSVVNVPGGGGFNFNRNMSNDFRMVRHPWEFLRVGAKASDSPAVVQNFDGTFSDFMYRIKNDVPPSEVSTDAIMAGARILGTTFANTYFTLNYLFKRTDGTTSEVDFSQLFNPNAPPQFGPGPFGSLLQPDTLNRAVNAALTPDLNGNGIPDGQDQQILNCLRSAYPQSQNFPDLGQGPPVPMTTGHAGEVILNPADVGNPSPGFDGSVYSDPRHPELHTGIAVPGVNQLKSDNTSYRVNGLGPTGDGLTHSSFCLDIPVQHNWTHIIGGTMTYNDYNYTGLVFRLEQSLSTKEGRQDSPSSARRLIELRDNPTTTQRGATPRDFETRANRYTQVWRSMVGFDRSGSLASNFGRKFSNPLLRSLLSDQWVISFQFLNQYDAHARNVNSNASFTNRFQHWNPFFTFSGSGFFLGQRFRPTWAVALDATSLTPLFFLQAQYFLTEKLEMRIGEVLYAGSAHAEDNSNLFYYADRDTFYVRLTYFLA